LKQRVAEGLLEFVDRRYPGFKALVEYCEVSTPLTVEHFTGHLWPPRLACLAAWASFGSWPPRKNSRRVSPANPAA
jgi:hypothetical protein